MNLSIVGFVIVISVIFALLEIQIEGEHGWARKLPTWRLKNPLRKIINWPYLTGYHFYLNILFLSILQLPFFVGFTFTLKNEIIILELFFAIMLLEDFLWFVFNPKWGVKRYFLEEIPWHAKKILFFPKNYWVGILMLLLLETVRRTII